MNTPTPNLKRSFAVQEIKKFEKFAVQKIKKIKNICSARNKEI